MLSGEVDVVQSAHPLRIPARRAVQAITIADLDFLDHPERTRAEIRRDYAALAPSHARRADLVVTISQYTAGQIRDRLDVTPERIVVCPPGAPSWAPRETPAPVGPILFVGTIEPRKNVPALLRAYERVAARRPDVPPLVLAGRSVEQSPEILAGTESPDLAGRVRYLGYVSDGERQRLYREASMLVLPSLEEGFGMPALEAMTVGVPVVASRRGALPEVVGDAGTLVDPLDGQALADAIEATLDPARSDAHARAGIVRARRFSWSDSAATLLEAYRWAVARKRDRAHA
jgi:glycosyltransferase involved in cell wall biosynthesis